MTLTADQIYRVALQAGFPSDTAVKMVAIALKESSGDSSAHNTTPPDDSYGLWQINMYGALAAKRVAAWGLSSPADLFDPLVNAKAAYSLWNGNDANLAANWYIDRGSDMQRYQSFLPLAQNAAALVAADVVTGGGGDTGTGAADFRSGQLGAAAPARPVVLRPPASTLPPWPPPGASFPPQQSSPSTWPPALSSLTYSVNAPAWWWWLVHTGGALLWMALVHYVPQIATPAVFAAVILHAVLPSPPGTPGAQKKGTVTP